jgi:hypothetical protein
MTLNPHRLGNQFTALPASVVGGQQPLSRLLERGVTIVAIIVTTRVHGTI